MGSLTKAGSFRSVGAARRLFCIPLAIAVAGLLALGAGSAFAKDNGHAFSFEFKPTGTAEFTKYQFGTQPYLINAAVDNSAGPSSGDIYVADYYGHRIEKFAPNGSFILMFGDNVNQTTSGDVCTAASGNTCKIGIEGNSAERFSCPAFLAVDSSAGPSAGDVYVGDTCQRKVHKYDENGNLLTGYGTGGALTGTESTFRSILGMTVNSSGQLFIRTCVECFENDNASLVTINEDGTLAGKVTTTSKDFRSGGVALSASGANMYYPSEYSTRYAVRRASASDGSGAVNFTVGAYEPPFNGFQAISQDIKTDSAGTLYAAMGNYGSGPGRIWEYQVNGSGQPLDSEGNPCAVVLSPSAGCPPTHEFGSKVLGNFPRTVAINNSNGTVYVTNDETFAVDVFIDAPEALAETEAGTWIATANGLAKPDGAGDITACKFEFGPTNTYGSSQPCEAAGPLPYTTDTAVHADLPGLNSDNQHTYHYRLVLENEAGAVSFGPDQTFVPSYVKGLQTLSPPENITRTQATLKGSYEDTGKTTEYHFEWGTSACPCPNSSTEEVAASTSLSALANKDGVLTHLKPQTVYHYRVVAKNEFGTSFGNDKTFETLPAVQTVTTEAANPVERRKATAKGSFQGDGTATTYTFEWGPTASYGNTLTSAGPISPAGLEHVQLVIDGCGTPDAKGCLEPSRSNKANPGPKVYHFRISATNELGTTKGGDQQFTTLPAVGSLETKPATSIDQEDITLNAKFAGNGEPTTYYFEYGLTSAYGKTTDEADAGEPAGAKEISSDITDYEAYETYHYRVVAKNPYGTTYGDDMTFEAEPALPPEVAETQASEITPTGATLEAKVNPNRWLTVYAFEYGTTEAYGESTEISHPIGADKTFHPVSAQISGLVPGLEYHYRVVAINFTAPTHGPDMTFTTPDVPRIGATSSSGVGQTTAHLATAVDPKLSPTTVTFEYGITPAYGHQTAPASINGGGGEQPSSADLTGLEPGTTYHYRVAATNEWGTSTGTDQTFTTQAAAAPPPEEEPKVVRCRKGFVKRHGRCVRRHRHHRHHKKHHRHGKRNG